MRKSLFIALLALLAPACSGASPLDPFEDAGVRSDAGTRDSGTVDTPDAGPIDVLDSGVVDGPDAGPTDPDPPECLAYDPPDDLGLDDDCDGAEGSLATSIYVAHDGDDVFAGSPDYPVKSLARALALHEATPTRTQVFVARSETPYDATGLGGLLTAGVSVHGSLLPEEAWARPEGSATAPATTFATTGDGVHADITDPVVSLTYARVVSTRQPGQAHALALSLSGPGTLALSYVDVWAEAGATGADGAAGNDGTPWAGTWEGTSLRFIDTSTGTEMFPITSVCEGFASRELTFGGTGGKGDGENSSPTDGLPGGGGALGGARGVKGARAGQDGQPGAQGIPGTNAASHDALAWSTTGGVVSWPALTPATRGTLGHGGGGGGGAQHGGNCGSIGYAGGGGSGGGGGCSGQPGQTGASGGFSVGMIVHGAWPSMTGVTITAGDGGAGGRGGRGGDGVEGRDGGVGSVVNSCPYGGGRGGDGGDGGAGGHGASGAGGWSIGILSDADTGIGDTSGVQITIGIAGIAGVPVEGGPAGEDGMAWSTYVE